MTFGEAITQARQAIQLQQKEVAAMTRKDNGAPISAQYLNDIEHDRRHPRNPRIIRQLASALNMDQDYLFFLAGRIPDDILNLHCSMEDVGLAMQVLRSKLRANKGPDRPSA